jgi:hypothetical protein
LNDQFNGQLFGETQIKISETMASKRKSDDDSTEEKDANKKFAKSVKKSLAKAADGSMSVKELLKAHGDGESKDDFKVKLKAAGFTVNGKVVTMDESVTATTATTTEPVSEKKDKKAKKSKTETEEASPAPKKSTSTVSAKDQEAIDQWREANLVQVLA